MVRNPTVASPYAFAALVVLATVPFFVLGSLTDATLVPGVPLTGLAVVCPGAVASVLVLRHRGPRGLGAWLAASWTLPRRQWGWVVPALVFVPTVMAASCLVQNALSWSPLDPVPPGRVWALAPAFVVAAWLEELGWSGYATGPLVRRWGVGGASLALGCLWALWHWGALVQAHHDATWIAWWSLGTLAHRFILVLLVTRTGRVVVATLYHASINLGWQLSPGGPGAYDPAVFGVLFAALALGLGGLLALERRLGGRS